MAGRGDDPPKGNAAVRRVHLGVCDDCVSVLDENMASDEVDVVGVLDDPGLGHDEDGRPEPVNLKSSVVVNCENVLSNSIEGPPKKMID